VSAYRLVIDGWHPARLNELLGCHWAAAAQRKKHDRTLVCVESRIQSVPKARGPRRVSLLLTMAPKQRRPDPDCWFKSLLDALVHAGLLIDDGPKWCTLGGVTYDRGPKKRTTIALEDLP
jgi:Holliday junction resolvase RusA-like endonuclease